MLTHIYDWYRIVESHPKDEKLEKYKVVMEGIVKLISKSTDSLVSCVAGVAGGFEKFPKDGPFILEIIKLHHDQILAFPSKVSDNALALRVTCAVALGEYITRNTKSVLSISLSPSLYLASRDLVKLSNKKHLNQMLQELQDLSEKILEEQAEKQRKRQSLDLVAFQKVGADQAGLDALGAKILDTFQILDRQMMADREEMEVLWWYQNGISTGLNIPLSKIPSFAASIRSGVEVAQRVNIPALRSMKSVAAQAVEKDRQQNETVAKPLKDVIKEVDADTLNLLIPTNEAIHKYIDSFPILFPLSWLAIRGRDGNRPATLLPEFKKKTGCDFIEKVAPANIARQTFNEQVAKKALSGLVKE